MRTDKDLPHLNSVNAVLIDYSGSTSAHGIPRIITSRSVKSRLFWSFVTLVCLGAFLWQGSLLLLDFSKYPYTTQIDVVARTELQFPAVTVCNMNKMKRSAMVHTRFQSLIQADLGVNGGDADYSWWFDWSSQWSQEEEEQEEQEEQELASASAPDTGSSSSDWSSDAREHYSEQAPALVTGSSTSSSDSSSDAQEHYSEQYEWWDPGWDTDGFDFHEYDWTNVSDDDDWEGFYKQSTSDDFSDLLEVVNPTREELKVMGHQAEDFILQCTFDRHQCNYTVKRDSLFLMRTDKDLPHLNSVNAVLIDYSGLHLTLFTEQPEYVGLFAQEAGVRVAIHPPNVFPFPEDDGVVASTGQATDIGMRQSYFNRLPHPHGNCTEGTRTIFMSEEYAYTTRACVKSCVQQQLFDNCGCVTDIIMNETMCGARNKSQQVCRQAIEHFHEDQSSCNCPIACEETLFATVATSSHWPSERYEGHLKTRLTNGNARRILDDHGQTSRNLARVRIYFEELNFEQMIQKPKYTIESLLGGIGGLLGLYIGFSVITICEVGVLVVDLVKFLLRKAYNRREKIVPIELKC
eukprot:XP_011662582.1 PREDICTED: degenerin mec-10-like [Strongylocentrotus purpuratus]